MLKKLTWSIIILAGCQMPVEVADEDISTEPALEGDVAKASYSVGYAIGENIERQFGASIELDSFVRGAADGVGRAERLVDFEEGRRTLAVLNEKREALRAAEATAAQSDGGRFLTANGAKNEIVTLPSGMQYKILVVGDGSKPGPTDTVVTHYHGTLVDGSVFDSSVDRGEPATFPVNRVIAGWTEALQLMAVGSKWRLFIPPELAYGKRPPPGSSIPANATLIFEVELLEIQ